MLLFLGGQSIQQGVESHLHDNRDLGGGDIIRPFLDPGPRDFIGDVSTPGFKGCQVRHLPSFVNIAEDESGFDKGRVTGLEQELLEVGDALPLVPMKGRTVAAAQKAMKIKASLLQAAKDTAPGGDAVLPIDGFLHSVIDGLGDEFTHLAVPSGIVNGEAPALNHQYFVRAGARCLTSLRAYGTAHVQVLHGRRLGFRSGE